MTYIQVEEKEEVPNRSLVGKVLDYWQDRGLTIEEDYSITAKDKYIEVLYGSCWFIHVFHIEGGEIIEEAVGKHTFKDEAEAASFLNWYLLWLMERTDKD